MSDAPDQLELRFPDCLAADFPTEVPLASGAVDAVIGAVAGSDFTPLIRRSPGLAGSEFPTYLRCSIVRMAHAAAAVATRQVRRGAVLDYGAYFGNFALMFRRAGFDVTAVDAYRVYETAFDGVNALLASEGVAHRDFEDVGFDLHGFPDASFDVVLCMGVIEHVPVTPRFLLGALTRVLAPGGVLVMDTPNLVHLYNRQKFARGESVMPDLPTFYFGDPPFEGHHREYTADEMVWMLKEAGHEGITVELYNYSTYGTPSLQGRDVYNHWATVRAPELREVIMTVSQKPPASIAKALAGGDGWRAHLVDPEHYWQAQCPPDIAAHAADAGFAAERLIERLQQEVNLRDGKLRELQQQVLDEAQVRVHLQDEINRRDALLAEERRRYDQTVDARARRRAAQLRRLVRGR
ncbi:MAG: class I SAM-dependent methyltransferase [Vicinamibacterales bacterium]|nr:class I SAM-dependent methyltransferase [Vicinamibacterales bacterium]